MSGAADALRLLAAQLRDEGTPISPHVVEPRAEPDLGLLAAAGSAAAAAPAQYALVVEAVREGYLLHYGQPRLLDGQDPDLALLAGDYLYALGLERLAALGDDDAVRELADLISLCAQLHSEGREAAVPALWTAAATVVGSGPSDEHDAAKLALRSGQPHRCRSE
ncbi:MAG TPA: hypothetical protein VND98_01690 [Solirubrobacterales bacterium]|jgi:hypothetical protein|nr:hypothetical protein [Solirubrobacterales bacterium]